MTRSPSKFHMDALPALLLFAVFAACVLSVLLTGGQVYQRLAQRDDASYDRRTVTRYLTTKVRQSGGIEAVSLSDFGQGQALVLFEEIGGEIYLTRLYCHDGRLRELFCAAEDPLSPEDGEEILPLEALSCRLEGSLLTLILTEEDGDTIQLNLALQGGEGDGR